MIPFAPPAPDPGGPHRPPCGSFAQPPDPSPTRDDATPEVEPEPEPEPEPGPEPEPKSETEQEPEPEPETEDLEEPADPFLEIREEMAAAGTESRRTARRQMEVLKEFGTAIDAIGNLVRDLHAATRAEAAKPATAAPAAETAALHLPLIEMADRLARAAAAFSSPPAAAAPSWWPVSRTAPAPWQAAWASQKDALFILCSHMDTLLARAGLERLPAAGEVFDPATMSAAEVITDPTRPDHTVVAELLSGWRLTPAGPLIRPAQVKVSRIS